jgi:hypothetical protein
MSEADGQAFKSGFAAANDVAAQAATDQPGQSGDHD